MRDSLDPLPELGSEPSSLPVRPSAVINLGKSIALPPVRQTGRKSKIVIFGNDTQQPEK